MEKIRLFHKDVILLSGIMKKLNVMKMKNVILSVLVGSTLILASCGGSGYTTDQEAVVEGYENMKETHKSYYEEAMEIEKAYREDRDEIVKDYEGKSFREKEGKLLEKAASDDEAKGHLEDLRNLQFSYECDMQELSYANWKANWGIKQAVRDQKNMLEKDALKSFNDKTDPVKKDLQKMESDHYEAVGKLAENK